LAGVGVLVVVLDVLALVLVLVLVDDVLLELPLDDSLLLDEADDVELEPPPFLLP
jgi:hypothetical protein